MTTRSIRFDPAAPLEPGSVTTIHEWYRSPDGRFGAGFWASEPGKMDVSYDEDEFCQILAGLVRLTDAEGVTETYRAGDSFLIPRGFKGVWETVEAVRKFYVVYL